MQTYESTDAWKQHGRELFGDNPEAWRFVCPRCEHEQSKMTHPHETRMAYKVCYRCSFSARNTGLVSIPMRARVRTRSIDGGFYQDVFGFALVDMAAKKDANLAAQRRQKPRIYGPDGTLLEGEASSDAADFLQREFGYRRG